MDIEKIKKAGVNYDEGLERFANKQALYEKYLVKFFNDNSIYTLGTLLEEEDYEEAFKQAHTLKGSAGNLSLTPIYESACALVSALRGNQTKKTTDIYQQLLASYNTIKPLI